MKVFGIGLNKTGTKTLGHYLRQLGLRHRSYDSNVVDRSASFDLYRAGRTREFPPPPPHAPPVAPGVRNRARFDRGLRIATRHYRPHSDDFPVVFYAASARPSSPTVRAWRSHHPGLEVVKTSGAHTGRRSFLRQAWVEPVVVDLADRLRQARAQR